RDRVVDPGRVAVGVDDGDDRDAEPLRLRHRDLLLAGVDDEDGRGQLLHRLDADERLLELLALAVELERLLLRHPLKLARLLHLVRRPASSFGLPLPRFVGAPRPAGTRSQARLAYGCGSHCGPARSKGPHYHRKRAACVMVGLRRVFGVDAHVLLAQVAGPDAVLAAAETQVDRDLVLPAPHDLPDALQAHALA